MKKTAVLRHFSFMIGVVSVLSLVSGCSNTTLKIKDDSAHTPMIKSSWAINESFTAELDVAKTKGDSAYLHPAGRGLNLGALSVPGPATLENDFTLQSSYLGLSVNIIERPHTVINAAAGLKKVDMDLDVLFAGTRYAFDGESTGPSAKVDVIIPLSEKMYALFYASLTIFEAGDDGHLFDGGISLEYRIHKNTYLHAGWLGWDYENTNYKSDINIDTDGLSYGLRFAF